MKFRPGDIISNAAETRPPNLTAVAQVPLFAQLVRGKAFPIAYWH